MIGIFQVRLQYVFVCVSHFVLSAMRFEINVFMWLFLMCYLLKMPRGDPGGYTNKAFGVASEKRIFFFRVVSKKNNARSFFGVDSKEVNCV